MHPVLEIVLPFLLGCLSGFIGGLSSGGGLISIPGLIFFGLSPSASIATTRLSALSSDLSALVRFKKEGIIRWKQALPFIAIAILGGIVGSKLLLQIDENTLEKVVGFLLLLLAPLLAFNKDFGLTNIKRSKTHHRAGFLMVFLVMVYSAMFGGGGATFLIYVLVYFYGMSIIPAKANGALTGLFATATALIAFISAGVVDFGVGIPLMVGATIGGYLGAHTAIKKGNEWVRLVFLFIVIASSIKLLFF